MRLKRLSFLTLGHMTSDFYPGMLSPLLPLLLDRYGLSMTMAGVLVMVIQIFSNLTQPVIGILNDKRPLKSFLWMGLLISAIPFGFLLEFKRLELMVITLAISGIGVGMYHPVAAVAAGLNAREDRRGISMAYFSSGGSVGFMIAPLIVVFVVETIGEHYLPLVILPALIMTIYFIFNRDIVVSEGHRLSPHEWFTALMGSKRELTILWLVSSLRAMTYVLVSSFLPLLAMARGSSYVTSNYILSVSLLAAIVGMFIGGHMSDIHGGRKIMSITLLISSPLLFAFLKTSGIFSVILLLMSMGALSSTIPVNIVLAQRAAPKHSGMASSLVMGLSFALGALAAPPFGALADRIGIESAMKVILFIPVLGGLLVFLLRKECYNS